MVTNATIESVKEMDEEVFGGGGDALNYLRKLAEAPNLPVQVGNWLVSRVQELANHVVARDPVQWLSYCAPPLKLAPSPESITAEVMSDCLPSHLDYLITQQSPDGFWDVTWSWADYLDVWEVAKVEWRGVLTFDTLVSLKAYGRVEI
jgi:hypothetical protein